MAGCTALQALRDVGNYAPGMRVLVNGAAGGIGHWVVQLAVANDCQVTGVCSTTNVEFVRELGAQSVIDYRHEDFTATEERFDLIIDVVGNVPSRDMASLLVPGGTYVDVGGIAGNGRILGPAAHQFRTALTSPFVRGKRLRMITEQRRHEDLAQLAQLIDDGKVATHVSRTWPLAETPEAMAHIATGHARGKVVVTIA
jgi:NADPH:quinone reductase-like Zn-dependent oxidoreductase